MKTVQHPADNNQEQAHTRSVADQLPLDRELKGKTCEVANAVFTVADQLPLDRELKEEGHDHLRAAITKLQTNSR